MCGNVGFFCGTQFNQSIDAPGNCVGCPLLNGYDSAFSDWNDSASVRAGERRILKDELDDPAQLALPRHLLPVLDHPKILQLGTEAQKTISIHSLYRYLGMTAQLETKIVGETVNSLAAGRYWPCLPEELILDARRIAVDESYHALFTIDIMQQTRIATEVPVLNYSPRFMRVLQQVTDGLEQKERELVYLYFVVISETLITGVLKMDDGDAPRAVTDSVRDHFLDELLHHAFFRDLLFAMWPTLTTQQRDLLGRLTPRLVDAFVMPDFEMIKRELVTVGLSESQALTVCEESYPTELVASHIETSTRMLRKYLTRLNVENRHEITEIRSVFE